MIYYIRKLLFARRSNMIGEYDKAKKILNKYNQKHIIEFLKSPDGSINNELVKQVLNIDFDELKELYNKTFESLYVDLEELEPIAGINPRKLAKETLEEYEKIGIDIIKSNKFAVSTMAGGQGTRLRL